MQKKQLAQELRQRQYKLGQVSRQQIDAVADDDIIESYITCSGCGARLVDDTQLRMAIHTAQDAAHFLRLTANPGDSHTH